MNEGKISEVFKSIQGEGIYAGISQVFVRFFGCNLNCKFCDTKLTSYREYSSSELLHRIKQIPGCFHSVCLTGGEPLCQVNFLKDFLNLLKKHKVKVYLETNGILFDALEIIINKIDIIAMDIKLPSSTGLKGFWSEQQKFLSIAKAKEVFIKIIICNSTTQEDIKKAIKLLVKIVPRVKLVLQPDHKQLSCALLNKISEFQDFSQKFIPDVRIIPQVHKLLGLD